MQINNLLSAGVGIIGGADGPTNIYVSGDLGEALGIMANGMLGIFVVIGLIAIIVALLGRIGSRRP